MKQQGQFPAILPLGMAASYVMFGKPGIGISGSLALSSLNGSNLYPDRKSL